MRICEMVAAKRMLWLLVLTFTPWSTQAGAAWRSSTNGTDHHYTVPYTEVQVESQISPLVLPHDEGEERGPLPPVDEDESRIYFSERGLRCSAAASSEAVNTALRWKESENKSLKVREKQNPWNVSILLVAMMKEVLRECGLVLTCDARYGQHSVLQDILRLPDSRQMEQTTSKEVLLKTVWKSSMCCGYPLLDSLEPLLTTTSNYSSSLEYHGSRRRRRSSGTSGTYCGDGNCSLALSLAIRNVDQDLSLVDLVLYLISLTSGRQFYLVYDDVMPGVEMVLRSLQEVLGDTTLLPYDPNILLLTEVLTSNYHVQAMRTVFILCSVTHLYSIFQQVRDKALESPTIQWLVIVDVDLTEDLPLLLREGTQVALVQRVTPQKAQLFSSRVDPDGQVRFHQVGWWTVSGSWRSSSHQVKGRLLPDLQQLYSDFQGRQLVFATIDNWPFVKTKTLKNGTIIPISGIDLSLVNTLGETLNYTYQIVRPPDGKWGGPRPDGTITGMVGMVARHEAHAIFSELTITALRETVVDFTVPYYLGTTTLVSPAPKIKNQSFAILSPFTLEVWLCICLVTVLVGPLLYLVTRLLVLYLGEEDTAQYSLQSFSFNMYRSLMVQGNLITSHRWSLRFIFLSWYLFSLYMYAMYSGTLTAVLAITTFEKPIDSLHELAQALSHGYTLGAVRDSSFVDTFKNAKSGVYQEVWQLFNHEEPDQSFMPTPDAGMDMVLKKKFIFINSRLNSKLKAAQRGRNKFHIGRQTFLPQGSGIAFSNGSPYRDVFSSILIRLTEVGLLYKWANDEVNTVSQFMFTSSDAGPTAISLQHLQAAFFIMVLGFATSGILLVVEIMVGRWWQNIRVASIEEDVIQVENHRSQSGQATAGLQFT